MTNIHTDVLQSNNTFPSSSRPLAISGDAPHWTVFGLIGHLSYDLMALWGKQADDDCEGALMCQKRVNAVTAVWLQVLSTGLHYISSNDIDTIETYFSSSICLLSTYSFPFFPPLSIYVIRRSCICENEAPTWLGEELWLGKWTFPRCIYISTREHQFVKSNPSSNISRLTCPWNGQNNPEIQTVAAQRVYFPAEILSFCLDAQILTQLDANSIIIKSFKNVPISVMRCQRSSQPHAV